MPDIAITCSKCETITTVSEFVDETKLKCRKCGGRLEKPGALTAAIARHEATTSTEQPPTPTQRGGLRLAKRNREYTPIPKTGDEPITPIMPIPPPEVQTGSLELRPQIKDDKKHINHTLIASLLFVILGGAMGYLRYGGVLRPHILDMAIEYSWIAFMIFHVMIVLKAMTDSILQGVLCLFVPGYSLFYIFTISDDFYLRAIFAGLLVGIGQDTAFKLNIYALKIINIVHSFIAGGGGDIR